MNDAEREATTRTRRVDPRLKAAGWSVVRCTSGDPSSYPPARAVEEFPTAAGPADYALTGQHQVVAVVEAKKLSLGPQGVLVQAERYSKGLDQGIRYQGEFGVPFLYSTNGEDIWFHDVRESLNRSRQVARFHTPGALDEMLTRDTTAELDRLLSIPWSSVLRDYQIEADTAIEEAIRSRKRKMLLTMATGTGKTLTLVSEIYRLMKSGAARRVLFLVDRRALAAQAVRAFASFEAEPGLKFDKIYEVYSQRFQQGDLDPDEKWDPNIMPNALLTAPKLGDAFVYVCTIQRMTINLFGKQAVLPWATEEGEDADATQLDIPIHAFDLIVADECHRGYSAQELSTWRQTLDHFDAIKVGLTATPALHTMAYFENIVYRYEYERAVREGHLVDYDAIRIKSDVRMNGIFLKEGDQVDQVDTETGAKQLDLLEDERTYDATQVERQITAPDSNRKILEEIKKYAEAHEAETGHFPKTLIFAVNDLPHTSHADQLVKQAREIFDRGESFVAKITGRVDRPLQRIREFRNRPNPGVVVTVDLLTTGVDIPDLEFIVFLRPVKSRILFEQMLGRGTRKGERYPTKSHFVVFDCFDGTLLEYFRDTTGMTAEPPSAPTRTVDKIIDDIWQNRDRAYNVHCLVKRLRRIDKEMSGDAIEQFARFIPGGDVGHFAEDLSASLRDNFSGTMKVLRDEDFQSLLVAYPRPQKSFLVAPGAIDTVESGWLIKGAIGKEYKPEDYLNLFVSFVKDNQQHLEAISIILAHPEKWGTRPLSDLIESLNRAPEHFTAQNLQRAFQITHHKALADLISMIKRAALDTSPLLTAEERVDAAIERATTKAQLTDDQRRWLGYIRQHLVLNLSIERDDFDLQPVLSDRGGWVPANRAFEGQLDELLANLNRELVSA
jgi:type I restriction enzyme R subunit